MKEILFKEDEMKYKEEIKKYLTTHSSYTKIDDVRIDLLAPCTKYESSFDRAWKELVGLGEIEICGNEIKIKGGRDDI